MVIIARVPGFIARGHNLYIQPSILKFYLDTCRSVFHTIVV